MKRFKNSFLNKKLKKAKQSFFQNKKKHKLRLSPKIFSYAKENKDRAIKQELKVYHLLRAFFNFKIYQQHIIDQKYIVDLYIPVKNLIIEIDGTYHNDEEQKAKDYLREKYLRNMGFDIMRFTNEEVDTDLMQILDKLKYKFSDDKYALQAKQK